MYITSLAVKNFRNLADFTLKFDRKSNIIIGDNAQGKTNILEAVYTAINAKSFRTRNDLELINSCQNYCHINLNFIKNQREQQIEMIISRDAKKKIKINQVAISKTFELIGYLNVILFAPEDLKLIKGGPTERRRFLDREISNINRNYLNSLIKYHRVLNQKNRFLKVCKESDNWQSFEIWDEQLAKYAQKIIKKRIEYIKLLNEKARLIHAEISGKNEVIRLEYNSDLIAETETEIEKKILLKLEKSRQRDIKYGYTTVGPQRDDLTILINDQNIKKYGSQGQQRSALLAIKLAQIEIIKDIVGEYPILMLDDVMSELDSNRQIHLLTEIKRTQTILTTTDLNGLDSKDISPYWRHFIADGSIKSSQEVVSAQ